MVPPNTAAAPRPPLHTCLLCNISTASLATWASHTKHLLCTQAPVDVASRTYEVILKAAAREGDMGVAQTAMAAMGKHGIPASYLAHECLLRTLCASGSLGVSTVRKIRTHPIHKSSVHTLSTVYGKPT